MKVPHIQTFSYCDGLRACVDGEGGGEWEEKGV